VGGVVNFVTRAIPQDFGIEAGWKVSSAQPLHKTTRRDAQPDGGRHMRTTVLAPRCSTPARGGDQREHSATRIDDLMLKKQICAE
jgi:Fe(3+) dicitrate transport protein